MDPITLGIVMVTVGAAFFATSRFKPKLVRAQAQEAILRSRALGDTTPQVFFDKANIVPALDVYDIMDISIKTVPISLLGREGVHCRDNIRADVQATIYVKVPRNAENVLLVAQTVGCARASNPETLKQLFSGKLTEAFRIVLKKLDFEEALAKLDAVRENIIQVVGVELNGFHLQDLSIESFEQTPLEKLDPANILDAEGITKITDRTASQLVATNKLRRAAEREVRRKDAEAREHQEMKSEQV